MKLTKISQVVDPFSTKPATKPPPPPPPRNNQAIAEALVAAARGLGLDAIATQISGSGGFTEWSVMCNGRRVSAQAGIQSSDIEIIFDIPPTGSMTGRVLRGMETGPADHVMRNIVADAVKGAGIAAQQVGRDVNTELCMNPDAYKGRQDNPQSTPQMGVQQNGMA